MRVGNFTSTNSQSKCEFDACKVIHVLQDGITKERKLEFIVDDLTFKEHVDSFIQYIKSNHEADITSFIELIFPLTADEDNKGEIVSYITSSLINAIAEGDENHLDIGKKIRDSVHNKLLGLAIPSQYTSKHPQLLLMGAVIFPGEYGAPSVEISSMIEEYNKNDIKPQWWQSFPPVNNAFTLKSIKSIDARYETESHLSKLFNVKPDGACFFRAYMAIKLRDDFWLSRATKGEVLSVINYKGQLDCSLGQGSTSLADIIKEQIHEAICELKSVYSCQGTIEKTLLDKLDEERLYDKTIGNGLFDLYCADGVRKAFNKSDLQRASDCDEFFTIIADAIGNKFMEKLGLGTQYDGSDFSAYLKQNDSHDHFDVIAPYDYFDRVTDYGRIYEDNVYSPKSLNFIQDTSIPPNELINRVVNSRVKRREFTGRLLEACCLAMTANIQPTSADMGLRLQRPLALCEPGEDNPHSVFSNQMDACWTGYSELESKEQAQIIKIECSGHQGNGLAYAQYGINGKVFNGENAFFKVIIYAKNNALSDNEIEKKAKKLSHNIMDYLRSHAEQLGLLLQRGIEDGLGLECGKESFDECEWRPATPPVGPSNTGSGIASAALALMQLVASSMNGYRAVANHHYMVWQQRQNYPRPKPEAPVDGNTLDRWFTANNCVDTPQAGAANGNDGVASSLFNINSSVMKGVFNLVDGISTVLDEGARYLPPYLVGADAASLGHPKASSFNSGNGTSETMSKIDGEPNVVVGTALLPSIRLPKSALDLLNAKRETEVRLKNDKTLHPDISKFVKKPRALNDSVTKKVIPGMLVLENKYQQFIVLNLLSRNYFIFSKIGVQHQSMPVIAIATFSPRRKEFSELMSFMLPEVTNPLNAMYYLSDFNPARIFSSMYSDMQQNAVLRPYLEAESKKEVTTESEATKLMSTSSSEPPPLTEKTTTNEVGDVSSSTVANSIASQLPATSSEPPPLMEKTTTNEVGDISSSTVANSIASQLPATSSEAPPLTEMPTTNDISSSTLANSIASQPPATIRPPVHFVLSEGMLDVLIKIKCQNFVKDATQPLERRQAVQAYLDGTLSGRTLWHGNAIFIDIFALESPGGLVVFSLSENWHTYIPERLHKYSTDCRDIQVGPFSSRTITYCYNHEQRYFDWDNNWEFKAKMRVATPRFPSEINDWVFYTHKNGDGPVVQNLILRASGRPLAEEVWPRLNEPRHLPWLSKIQDHLQMFGDESDLMVQTLKEYLFNTSRPLPNNAMMKRLVTYLQQQVDQISAPFFHPNRVVHNEIIKEIKEYERVLGRSTNLTPDTVLEVMIYRSNKPMVTESDYTKSKVTLLDYALGHLNRDKPITGVIFLPAEHRDFLKKLQGKISNLQNGMLNKIEEYKNSPRRMDVLRTHYRGEIILHCLKLLAAPDNKVAISHKNLIIDFLRGKKAAMGVEITGTSIMNSKGTPLRNLFFIPSGEERTPLVARFLAYKGYKELPPIGIIVSLDDARVWEMNDTTIFSLLQNTEFRNFVLKAFMLKDLSNVEDAFKIRVVLDFGKGERRYLPLNVFPMGGVDDVAKSLATIGLDHLHSNIDHLFYTDREAFLRFFRTTAQEIISTAMLYSSLVGVPAGIVGRVLMLSLDTGLSAASVALSVNEYLMATKDSEKESALIDILAGAFSGLFITPTALATIQDVRASASLLNVYSRINTMSSDFSQLLVWEKASLGDKVKLLLSHSHAAQELAKAFGEQQLARVIQGHLLDSETDIQTLSTELDRLLAENKRTYPLGFFRRSPRSNNPAEVVREPILPLVPESPSLPLPIELRNAEQELRAKPAIGRMMNNPSEYCEAAVPHVKEFMLEKGMTDIKVRGMYIWANGGDDLPMNHFVVIGRFNKHSYVFDVTAGQFAPAIDTPLILPLSDWERRYQQAWKTKVIKFADFSSLAQARSTFSVMNRLRPTEVMESVHVLAAPGWYRAQSQASSSSAAMMPLRFGGRTALHNAVRESIAQGNTGADVSWDYAFRMVRKSGGGRPELLSQLQQLATRSGSGEIASEISSILSGSRRLSSFDEALRVPTGELLLFFREGKLAHVMVSLGGGRYAGIKNDALNPLLGGGRQIVSVEQLGQFTEGRILPWANSNRLQAAPTELAMEVYAGMPLRENSSTLMSQHIGRPGADSILLDSGLSEEQIDAFNRALRNPNWVSIQLLSSPQDINGVEQLNSFEKGFVIMPKSGTTGSAWVSAGNGDFVSIFSGSVEKASMIPLQYQLQAGLVNVQQLRSSALFGRDAIVDFDELSGTLSVRIHGAPNNLNHMDAGEFSNVLRGWMIGQNYQAHRIKRINLQSCFGGIGSYSSGQVLANEFNVPVKTYRWRYSVARAHDLLNEVIFQPMPAKTPAEIEAVMSVTRRHARNHEFWNTLITGLYRVIGRGRVARAVAETDQIDWRASYPQISAVAFLVLGMETIDKFLGNNKNAWFWGGQDLNLTDKERNDFKEKMKLELRGILPPPGNETLSIELFKQRCEEVMKLNPYTYFYVKNIFE